MVSSPYLVNVGQKLIVDMEKWPSGMCVPMCGGPATKTTIAVDPYRLRLVLTDALISCDQLPLGMVEATEVIQICEEKHWKELSVRARLKLALIHVSVLICVAAICCVVCGVC